MSSLPCSTGRSAVAARPPRPSGPSLAAEGRVAPVEVEVSRTWLSPNGRLRLVEVLERRSRRVTLESQVVWESVQGPDGKVDLRALEKAVREAYEDLRRLERGRRAGERPPPCPDRFHYYPRKDILLLTLEMLRVQRKEAVWETSRRSRRTHAGPARCPETIPRNAQSTRP